VRHRCHGYHTLLSRETTVTPWGIHFGDYDRKTVEQEREDILAGGGYRLLNTKIITTNDRQADIDARVARLNTRVVVPLPEQLAALRAFAARNGRTWKRKLLDAWMTGRVDLEGPDAGHLRRIRNDFGPTWLASFRLPTA
jgi:hypothetical protein